MNTPNNKRRRESRRRIEDVFIQSLQTKELHEIRVTDICAAAGVNRTTFYANYVDIFALAEAVLERLKEEVLSLYQEEWAKKSSSHDFLKLFYHIKENPLMYRTYFKLNRGGGFRFIGYDLSDAMIRFDNRHIEYHIEFFGHGLNGIIRKWLDNDCRESPEEIVSIIIDEYKGLSL